MSRVAIVGTAEQLDNFKVSCADRNLMIGKLQPSISIKHLQLNKQDVKDICGFLDDLT